MSRHRSLSPRGTVPRAAVHIFVVLALVGAVTLLAMRAIDRLGPVEAADGVENRDGASAQQQDDLYERNPTLLVITDSIGGGADPTSKQYPEMVGEMMGWNVSVDAMGARGYLPTDLRAIDVDQVVPPVVDALKYDAGTYKADYIVVDVGRNDLGKNPLLVDEAMNEYLTELRSYYPQAKIFLIAPTYITPESKGIQAPAAQSTRSAAERIGAYVLDPIAEGWYQDIDLEPLMYEDGVHLSVAGSEFYAKKIVEGMRRAGAVPYYEVKGAR